MSNVMIQGRVLAPADIDTIRELIRQHPDWSRWRISRVLAEQWGWKNHAGQLKDMSSREMLLRLHAKGLITLPKQRCPPGSRSSRKRVTIAHVTDLIACPIQALGDVSLREVPHRDADEPLALHLMEKYHYLGYTYTIGENIRYMARDASNRVLAVAVWGSAALKIKSRDDWIGWNEATRMSNLHLLVNNTRYLILPWVRVPHLASHLLGRMARRLSSDWQKRYGHPVHLAETFVQVNRNRGTCYRAANWQALGITTGRTRREHDRTESTTAKQLFVSPLVSEQKMRRRLGVDQATQHQEEPTGDTQPSSPIR